MIFLLIATKSKIIRYYDNENAIAEFSGIKSYQYNHTNVYIGLPNEAYTKIHTDMQKSYMNTDRHTYRNAIFRHTTV